MRTNGARLQLVFVGAFWEVTMSKLNSKIFYLMPFVCGALIVSAPARADEVFSNASIINGLGAVDQRAVEAMQTCFNSDLAQDNQGRAIYACNTALKMATPDHALRSKILTRRGLRQLSSGRFDRAGRDFTSAARLNGDNSFACIGQGYTSLMKKKYDLALRVFASCSADGAAAPLAAYGSAITKELSGDIKGAYKDYHTAASMRPEWAKPRQELARFQKVKQAS